MPITFAVLDRWVQLISWRTANAGPMFKLWFYGQGSITSLGVGSSRGSRIKGGWVLDPWVIPVESACAAKGDDSPLDDEPHLLVAVLRIPTT